MRQRKRKVPQPKAVLVLRPGGQVTIHGKDGGELARSVKGAAALLDLGQVSMVSEAKDPALTREQLSQVLATNPSSIIQGLDGAARVSGLTGLDEQGQTAALVQVIGGQELASITGAAAAQGYQAVSFENGLLTALRSSDPSRATVLLQLGPSSNYAVISCGERFSRLREPAQQHPEAQFQAVGQMMTTVQQVLPLLSPETDQYQVMILGESELNRRIQEEFQQSGIECEVLTEEMLARAAFENSSAIPLEQQKAEKKQGRAVSHPWLPLVIGAAAGFLPYGVVAAQNNGIQKDTEQFQAQLDEYQPQLNEYDRLQGEIARIRTIEVNAEAITKNRVDWPKTYDRLLAKLPQEGGKYTLLFQALNASAGLSPVSVPEGQQEAVMPPPPQPSFDLTAKASQQAQATRTLEGLERSYQMNMQSLRRSKEDGKTAWILTASLIDPDAPTVSVGTSARKNTPSAQPASQTSSSTTAEATP